MALFGAQRRGSDAAERREGTKARSDLAVILEPLVRALMIRTLAQLPQQKRL
jgi:hypothetical protein